MRRPVRGRRRSRPAPRPGRSLPRPRGSPEPRARQGHCRGADALKGEISQIPGTGSSRGVGGPSMASLAPRPSPTAVRRDLGTRCAGPAGLPPLQVSSSGLSAKAGTRREGRVHWPAGWAPRRGRRRTRPRPAPPASDHGVGLLWRRRRGPSCGLRPASPTTSATPASGRTPIPARPTAPGPSPAPLPSSATRPATCTRRAVALGRPRGGPPSVALHRRDRGRSAVALRRRGAPLAFTGSTSSLNDQFFDPNLDGAPLHTSGRPEADLKDPQEDPGVQGVDSVS